MALSAFITCTFSLATARRVGFGRVGGQRRGRRPLGPWVRSSACLRIHDQGARTPTAPPRSSLMGAFVSVFTRWTARLPSHRSRPLRPSTAPSGASTRSPEPWLIADRRVAQHRRGGWSSRHRLVGHASTTRVDRLLRHEGAAVSLAWAAPWMLFVSFPNLRPGVDRTPGPARRNHPGCAPLMTMNSAAWLANPLPARNSLHEAVHPPRTRRWPAVTITLPRPTRPPSVSLTRSC